MASQEVIDILIEDPSDPSIFEEIADANIHRPEILVLMLKSPYTPAGVRERVGKALQLSTLPSSVKPPSDGEPEEVRAKTILQKIQMLNVPQRRQLALKGGREIRSVLIKDANKEVMINVLENPKISESEVEMLARSRATHDDALRKISKKREWMRSYPIILALATNPKTPPGMSVPLVKELKTKDLQAIEKNRNVSEAVRSASKKILMMKRGK
jgi:hypothetical protein